MTYQFVYTPTIICSEDASDGTRLVARPAKHLSIYARCTLHAISPNHRVLSATRRNIREVGLPLSTSALPRLEAAAAAAEEEEKTETSPPSPHPKSPTDASSEKGESGSAAAPTLPPSFRLHPHSIPPLPFSSSLPNRHSPPPNPPPLLENGGVAGEWGGIPRPPSSVLLRRRRGWWCNLVLGALID